MKIVAKCSAFASLSYQVQVKICNPIPLIIKQISGQTDYMHKFLIF